MYSYGAEVSRILELDGGGARPMELFPRQCSSSQARSRLLAASAQELFPGARDPESALSGLFLYFSCLTEAHDLLHTIPHVEGGYWHGIMHRMEGDAYNAGYWFRRIGRHPVFPAFQSEAAELGYMPGPAWDPFAFTGFCEAAARRPGSEDEALARRVQLAEWQLLFDYCATPATKVATH